MEVTRGHRQAYGFHTFPVGIVELDWRSGMPARVDESRARHYDELRWSPNGRAWRTQRDAAEIAGVSKGWARARDAQRLRPACPTCGHAQ